MEPVAPLLVAAAAFGGVWRLARRRRLSDRPAVEAAWRAAYPGDEIRDVALSSDGRSALVQTAWGTGVVCRRGQIARRLDHARAEADAAGLLLRLPDLDTPRIRLRLDPGLAALWQERIEQD